MDDLIARAESGDFAEYWLQQYIKENYNKLGFTSIEGPFDTGPDFKGVYQGRKVVIEAERAPKHFIYHRHDPKEVDILIVLNEEYFGVVLGMKPDEWRKLLPKHVIKVEAEDFVKATHAMRKAYALKKDEERERFDRILPYLRIKHAFAGLYNLFVEDFPHEGTPEHEDLDQALFYATQQYIQRNAIDVDALRNNRVFTDVEILYNDLIKSRREATHITERERALLESFEDDLRAARPGN